MDKLVSTDWLAAELGAPDLRVLDATSFLPEHGRDARAEYEAGHIPGAVFMDLKELADADHPVPGMLPPLHKFASRMQAMGVGDGSRIVVYDNSPNRSAARAWWMLRTFGARSIAILDGGMQKWTAEGRPVESGIADVRRGHFTPRLDGGAVASKEQVAAAIGNTQIVDARSGPRFRGEEPEARAGVEAGHIPESLNLPYATLFNVDNTYKQGDELRHTFEAAGVDLARPMITTCGSGVTAASLLFGALLLGKEDVRLYDGSWAEWGADPATPKAKGPA